MNPQNMYGAPPTQPNWGQPPPSGFPGAVQNGNNPQQANLVTQQMAGMNLGGPPKPVPNGGFAAPPGNYNNNNLGGPPPAMTNGTNGTTSPQQYPPQKFPGQPGPQQMGPPKPAGVPSFPPQSAPGPVPTMPQQQNAGFPPQGPPTQGLAPAPGPGFPPQAAPQGFPPQAAQPGFPPQAAQQVPARPPSQGFPPQQPSQPQNQGFPPQQQSQPPTQGFPPQQQNQPLAQGFPPQQQNQPPTQGFPPQQQNQPPAQGFPPQPGFPAQHQGLPPQPSATPGFQQPPASLSRPPMPGQPPLPGQQIPSPQQIPGPPMPGQMYAGSQGQAPPPLPGQPQYQQQQPGFNQPSYQQQQPRPSPYGQPGYPSAAPGGQPGYPQGPGGYPQAQQQAQRKLDPDQMPNPIQVIAENQKTSGGVFVTNQAGLVPPLVTTSFVTQDQGNSGPRFIRSTMYSVPATADIIKQSAVPFSLVISPLAETVENEYPPPVVDFGDLGPIRCVRCKAYMCPFMQFIDAGRRFQCLLCKVTTEVPAEYFQHLDHTGQRVDKYQRPELVLGTYEFVATKDYCRNNTPPKPPAIVFVIDVSYNNVKSGLVHLLCAQMREIIANLPKEQGQEKSAMKVGFITYNNTVHFYNVKSSLAQPQMMVVGDVQEMFMPLLDGFLCDPEESAVVIDSLMDQIPKMFGDTRETETILLPAIQAGLEALKASETNGKLLVFHSTLPVAEAPGKLKNRDDRKMLGTEKEKTILSPQCTSYNNLGQECVQAGCSVDLFVFNNSYIDLATIGQVARLTGGEVYKYTYFQADIDGKRVIADVVKNISRNVAFDAVMRVRTSTGIRPTDFYGHFFMSNTTDMEIASIDSSKSIAIEIKHDDKLPPEENVYIQVALLYTSISGQRRLRVLNLSLKTCTQLADLFRTCDLDTTILFLAKQGLYKLLENTPKAIKDNLVQRAAQILACYRKHCASPSSAGQLILPECMKLLPLYVNCMLKNDAFSGGSDMTLDDRSYAIYFVQSIDLPVSVGYFYPRLIPVHNADPEESDIPAAIRCSGEKIQDDGAYILENGIYMFLWLGLGVSPEFTQNVFGVQSSHQIDTDRNIIPVYDNKLSKRVRGIIDAIQDEKNRCMRVTLVRQRDKLEAVFRHFLVEDRGTDGSASYVDFLCHMHKEIRALLPS